MKLQVQDLTPEQRELQRQHACPACATAWTALGKACTGLTASSLPPCCQLELVAAVQSGSRQYCHQQLKWARGVELFRWLDATKPTTDIVADIDSHMQGEPYTGVVLAADLRRVHRAALLWRACRLQGTRNSCKDVYAAPCALCGAGGSGQNGLLTKEEAQQMRQYQAQLQLLSDPAALEQLCADTRALLSEQPA